MQTQETLEISIRVVKNVIIISLVSLILFCNFSLNQQQRKTFMRIIQSISVVLLFITAAEAQQRPFLYTILPNDVSPGNAFISYDAAYGEKTFEPFGGDKMEQTLGIRTRLGSSFTLLAHAGLTLNNGTSRSMQHAELLADILSGSDAVVQLSAGAGMRHEYGGTNVIVARALAGKQFALWNISGNLLLEKPLSSQRDGIDLMTTLGCSYTLSSLFHVGIEAVGQDLEGFWDDEEAEGGATLFAGPTVGLLVPGSNLQITLGGGPIIRATSSPRISSALRELPAVTGNGFVIRTSVSMAL
jgi:hypothetical protein